MNQANASFIVSCVVTFVRSLGIIAEEFHPNVLNGKVSCTRSDSSCFAPVPVTTGPERAIDLKLAAPTLPRRRS